MAIEWWKRFILKSTKLETSYNSSAAAYQKVNSSIVSKGDMNSFNEIFPLARMFPLAVIHRGYKIWHFHGDAIFEWPSKNMHCRQAFKDLYKKVLCWSLILKTRCTLDMLCAFNFIQKRLKHRSFPFNSQKFLSAAIFQSIHDDCL